MTLPAAKKPKLVADEENSSLLDDNLKVFQNSIQELYGMIDEIVSLSENDASNKKDINGILEKGIFAMMKCKQSQRKLCLYYEKDKKKSVAEAMSSVEQANLNYQNVLYQKQHLQKQIHSIQNIHNTDQTKKKNKNALLTMARQEMDQSSANDTNDDHDENIVNKFLAPKNDDTTNGTQESEQYSHLDPKQYQYTQNKLKEEIEFRQSSVKELQSSKTELQRVKKEYQQVSTFVSGLPKHARTLQQKFVQPLEQYFNVPTSSQERQSRLEHAQQLSAPLYTLFVQLSTFLQLQNQSDDSIYTGITLTIVNNENDNMQNHNQSEWLQTEKHVLQLHISLPLVTITNQTPKNDHSSIIVEFSHLTKLNLITAKTRPKNYDLFLSGLFDGDDGLTLPAIIYHHLIPKDDDDDTLNIVERMLTTTPYPDRNEQDEGHSFGIPYHWCQMIAGLSTYSNPKTTSKSTMTVMKQILTSLHSQVTLQSFIQHFEKSKSRSKGFYIPLHPSFSLLLPKNKSSIDTRVTRWEELSNTSAKQMDIPPSYEKEAHHLQYYCATIQAKGKNNVPLNAFVAIHKVGYPAIPPLWNLIKVSASNNNNKEIVKPRFDWGKRFGSFTTLQHSTSPLSDPTLEQLEARINVDFTQLVDSSVPDSFDWILAHQLHEIVQCWDEYCTKVNSDDNEDSPEEIMKKILQSRDKQQ